MKTKMKVISFKRTLPRSIVFRPNIQDNHKYVTLDKFIKGANVVGDEGIMWEDMNHQKCDVALMLGWVHEHGKIAPHLTFRQQIIDHQKNNNNRIVVADSNLFQYKDTENLLHYYRYSFDGVFPNTGEYCDQNPNPERWEQIKRECGVDLRKWRTDGNHILLCLQRNGGWSMGSVQVSTWAIETIKTLRKYTDRPIIIRSHPGDRNASAYVNEIQSVCHNTGIQNVSLSLQQPFMRDIKNAWAVVNHNSSPAVGAAIEGIPVFVTDPNKSQARDIANTELSRIENPIMFDRLPWVQRISQFHWSWSDLESGRCWAHMRKWV